jgi:hypothetical protein
MDDKVIEYRKKNHRCRYCKYFKTISPPLGYGYLSNFYMCNLKIKNISLLVLPVRGKFCRWYDLKVGD